MKYGQKTALNMLSMSPVTFDKWPNTLKEDHFETPFLLYLEKIFLEQIQTSRSTNEVLGNLLILVVMEPHNHMSYLCRFVFQYGFHRVFIGLTSSIIHMHYTTMEPIGSRVQ